MLKKISVFILSLVLLAAAIPAYAASSDGRLALLDSLGVIEGYEDGSYRLENNLTRAEFTKVAISVSEHRKAVSSALSTSPYSDVPHTLWSAPYIRLAAEKGYVNGYLDSTFRPDAPITFAEATAVFLRILGYSNSDFGAAWPTGPMAIAEDLGLTDGISIGYNDAITRGDTVTLLYNLLDENLKGTQTEYISVLSCSSFENVIIRATHKEDISIAGDKVLTSAGTFKKGTAFSEEWIGRTGELFIENGDTVKAFVPKAQTLKTYTVTGTMGADLLLDGTIYNWDDNLTIYYKSGVTSYGKASTDAKAGNTLTFFYDADGAIEYGLLKKAGSDTETAVRSETYVVYSTLNDGIITYKNGNMEKVMLDDGLPLYDGDTLVGSFMKAQLKMGDILKVVYDEEDDAEYVLRDTDGLKGPYTAENSGWKSSLPVNSATSYLRDGTPANAAAIEIYDILYYSESMNMVLAYTDKVTGTYKNASPSKDAPSSVTVGDKTYTIESVEAFRKLGASGTYSFGDTVTLLLGREGAVADVVGLSDAESKVIGFVTAAGTKSYETNLGDTYTGYSITVLQANGQTLEFETDKDYDTLLNKVVALTFSDGKASAKSIETNSISGTFDADTFTIGVNTVSPDVKILDTYAPDAYKSGSGMTIFPQRLDGVTIHASHVLYVGRDSRNRISELILKDVTGDLHSYGIVTKANSQSAGMSVAGSYAYIIGAKTGTYATNGSSFSIGSHAPAQFTYAGGQIYSITRLTEVSGVVSAISDNTVSYTDGSRYDISDASVYLRDDNYTYTLLKNSDVSPDTHTITAYYDRSLSAGGKIRVVVAREK